MRRTPHMGITTQDFDNDNENSKSVKIPKDFYEAEFKEANSYKKDEDRRLALIFEVQYEGETVEVGRFLTAKATTYSEELKKDSDVTDSDLGSVFNENGLLDSLEAEISARLQSAEWFEGDVPEGFMTEDEGGFIANNGDESELLADSVEAQLRDESFRVLIVTPDGDGGALIEDVDELVSSDQGESSESGSGDSVEDESKDSEEGDESSSSDDDKPTIFDHEDNQE